MILSSVRMSIPSKKRAEVLKILKMTAGQCRLRSKCLSCHIYEDVYDKNILMIMELWSCTEDMEEYLRTDEYRNMLLVMEMAVTEPEVRFDAISDSTGIETVEKARMYNRL